MCIICKMLACLYVVWKGDSVYQTMSYTLVLLIFGTTTPLYCVCSSISYVYSNTFMAYTLSMSSSCSQHVRTLAQFVCICTCVYVHTNTQWQVCCSEVWTTDSSKHTHSAGQQLWNVHCCSCLPTLFLCHVSRDGCHGSMVSERLQCE